MFKKEHKKYKYQNPILETMKQHKQDIENLSNKILELEETIIILKSTNDKNLKNNKLLKHDVYFLKKENAQLDYEINIYKEKQDNVLKFANEYGIKDIYELFDLIVSYKRENKHNKKYVDTSTNTDYYNIINIPKKYDTNCFSNTKLIKHNKYNIYNIFLYLAENIIKYVYYIYKKGINKELLNFILNFYINRKLNNDSLNNIDVPNIDEMDKMDEFGYVREITNKGFNTNSLYSIIDDISKKHILYDMLFKNKKKVKKKIKKKYTDNDYEEVIEKTVNNIVNQKDKQYDKNIMNDMYSHNRDLINKYLYYYDLYMDKRNNISKNDYKDIVNNILNIKSNLSRHNKIVSIYKEMNKYKLFSIKILYKYYTFENIPKHKIVRFVYLLNERLLDKLEKGELEMLDDINYSNISSEYDTEIEEDYKNIKEYKHVDDTSDSDASYWEQGYLY